MWRHTVRQTGTVLILCIVPFNPPNSQGRQGLVSPFCIGEEPETRGTCPEAPSIYWGEASTWVQAWLNKKPVPSGFVLLGKWYIWSKWSPNVRNVPWFEQYLTPGACSDCIGLHRKGCVILPTHRCPAQPASERHSHWQPRVLHSFPSLCSTEHDKSILWQVSWFEKSCVKLLEIGDKEKAKKHFCLQAYNLVNSMVKSGGVGSIASPFLPVEL